MLLLRTDPTNPDFISLVKFLDAELAIRDGDDYSFYAQFNKIENLKNVVIVYENNIAVGCGALKKFSPEATEVKRMFTLPEYRGKGIAALVLSELEKWAIEFGYEKCILETGQKQPEAIRLYEKSGYKRIPNYGQYAGLENSLCFEKKIIGL